MPLGPNPLCHYPRSPRLPAYDITSDVPDEPLVIRDLGPWNLYPTVTNGIEDVIEQLQAQGKLPPARRLFYFDSEGELTEAVIVDGRFCTYRYVPKEDP